MDGLPNFTDEQWKNYFACEEFLYSGEYLKDKNEAENMNNEPINFALGSTRTTDKVTRRQCEYLQSLANKTNSHIPTERSLLDYCTVDQMSFAIDLMKRGNQIKFI